MLMRGVITDIFIKNHMKNRSGLNKKYLQILRTNTKQNKTKFTKHTTTFNSFVKMNGTDIKRKEISQNKNDVTRNEGSTISQNRCFLGSPFHDPFSPKAAGPEAPSFWQFEDQFVDPRTNLKVSCDEVMSQKIPKY